MQAGGVHRRHLCRCASRSCDTVVREMAEGLPEGRDDVRWFFFFQAEDGIRDVAVTGVQTCALPILDANGDPWGLDRIDQGALPLSRTYTYTGTGAGVHAYIIDTGIWTLQPEFGGRARSEEHTSELQSRLHLVCRLLLEKKNRSDSISRLGWHKILTGEIVSPEALDANYMRISDAEIILDTSYYVLAAAF